MTRMTHDVTTAASTARRRDAARRCTAARRCAGLAAAGAARRPRRRRQPAKAKAVIQIWMWGGPSHLDTFDPKPEAGYDYCGPLEQADRHQRRRASGSANCCRCWPSRPTSTRIIRSMTHGINAHETAAYMVQTGRKPGERDRLSRRVGAVVSLFKGYDAGYKGLIPPYIVLTEPQGRFSEAGFLGPRYKPFATGGDPGADAVRRRGRRRRRASPTSGSSDRRELLHKLDTLGQRHAGRPAARGAATSAEEQAYDLILGDAGKVFDLSQEKDETARPLRPQHVRPVLPGGAAAGRARRALRHHQLQGLGHAQAALPDHAPEAAGDWTRAWPRCCRTSSDRGLLDSTIVWWGGEFGRTPKVAVGSAVERRARPLRQGASPPWSPAAASRAASVVGASDAKGEEVEDRPGLPARPDRQHLRAARHRPRRRSCRIREGLDVRVMPPASRRRQRGRAAEGDHVRRSQSDPMVRSHALGLAAAGARRRAGRASSRRRTRRGRATSIPPAGSAAPRCRSPSAGSSSTASQASLRLRRRRQGRRSSTSTKPLTAAGHPVARQASRSCLKAAERPGDRTARSPSSGAKLATFSRRSQPGAGRDRRRSGSPSTPGAEPGPRELRLETPQGAVEPAGLLRRPTCRSSSSASPTYASCRRIADSWRDACPATRDPNGRLRSRVDGRIVHALPAAAGAERPGHRPATWTATASRRRKGSGWSSRVSARAS